MSTTAPTRLNLPPTEARSYAAHGLATTSFSICDERHGREPRRLAGRVERRSLVFRTPKERESASMAPKDRKIGTILRSTLAKVVKEATHRQPPRRTPSAHKVSVNAH